MAALASRLLVGLLSLAALPAPAQAQLGVTLQFGDPNYYGRLSPVGLAVPSVYNVRPIAVQPRRWGPPLQPLYLRVPAGERANWSRYCRRYGACQAPVYFVQDRWYRDVVVPRHRRDRDRDRAGRGYGRGWDKGGPWGR